MDEENIKLQKNVDSKRKLYLKLLCWMGKCVCFKTEKKEEKGEASSWDRECDPERCCGMIVKCVEMRNEREEIQEVEFLEMYNLKKKMLNGNEKCVHYGRGRLWEDYEPVLDFML